MKKIIKKVFEIFETLLPLLFFILAIEAFFGHESLKGFLFLILANQISIMHRLDDFIDMFAYDENEEGEINAKP